MNIAKVFVSQCKGGGSDKIDQSRNTKVALETLLKEPPSDHIIGLNSKAAIKISCNVRFHPQSMELEEKETSYL